MHGYQINQESIKETLAKKSDDELLTFFKARHWIHYGHLACNDDRFIAIAKKAIASQTILMSNDRYGDNQTTLTRLEACLRMFGPDINSVQLNRLKRNRNLILQMVFEYCCNITELFIEEILFDFKRAPLQYEFPSKKPKKLISLKINSRKGMQRPLISFEKELQTFEFEDDGFRKDLEKLHAMSIHD